VNKYALKIVFFLFFLPYEFLVDFTSLLFFGIFLMLMILTARVSLDVSYLKDIEKIIKQPVLLTITFLLPPKIK